MKLILGKLALTILALLFIGPPSTTGAAQATIGTKYPIIHAEQPKSASDDESCFYFMSSKFTMDVPRIGFTYKGESRNFFDNPRLKNVTVMIDESATTPVAEETEYEVWSFYMNQATYTKEARCLPGVMVRK